MSRFDIVDRSLRDQPFTRSVEAVARRKARLREIRTVIRQILHKEWANDPEHCPRPLYRWDLLDRLNAIGDVGPVSVDYFLDSLEYLENTGYVELGDVGLQGLDRHGYLFVRTSEEIGGDPIDYVEVPGP